MVSDCPVCRLVIIDVIRTYKVGICIMSREGTVALRTVEGHDIETADDIDFQAHWFMSRKLAC